jgi:hypothetical protein
MTLVWPHKKDARGENTKTNYGMDTTGEKKKRTSKKNVDGRSTSSHDNKKFRTRSMEKQGGTELGFQKTATAVKKKHLDRYTDFSRNNYVYVCGFPYVNYDIYININHLLK